MTDKPPHLRLADALRDAGLIEMSFGAANFRYHDFRSALPDPASALDRELVEAMREARSPEQLAEIGAIRDAHHAGQWDATPAESEAWAASADGRSALGRLAKGE